MHPASRAAGRRAAGSRDKQRQKGARRRVKTAARQDVVDTAHPCTPNKAHVVQLFPTFCPSATPGREQDERRVTLFRHPLDQVLLPFAASIQIHATE